MQTAPQYVSDLSQSTTNSKYLLLGAGAFFFFLICKTRMHSSRMRTDRSLTNGGCTCPGGTCRRCTCPGAVPAQVLPPVNRMTDRCKNMTLPQTSFAGGNKFTCKYYLHSLKPSDWTQMLWYTRSVGQSVNTSRI